MGTGIVLEAMLCQLLQCIDQRVSVAEPEAFGQIVDAHLAVRAVDALEESHRQSGAR